MWSRLADWLSQQLKDRNLSASEASVGAGLNRTAISKFINGTQPKVDSCQKLARFFGVPDKFVLELAGYFPPENVDEFVREVSYLAGRVPKQNRQMILALLRTAVEREKGEAPESEE